MFTTLWLGLFGFGTIGLFYSGDPEGWLCLAITLSGLAFFYYKFGKVRHVYLRDGRFYISDFGRQCEVPVSELQRVKGGRWINPQTVTMYFRHDTGFGKKVVFIARWYWLSGFEEHPIVDELRRIIRKQSRLG